MANLSTRFFGLDLKSPIVVASSTLTSQPGQIAKMAKAGAGAVVLKSLFEEEIYFQLQEEMGKRSELPADPEYLDYFDYIIKEENIKNYIRLIQDTKSKVDIPVVASISCISSSDWTLFARKLQDAGADALELNLFVIPSDIEKSNSHNEQFYFDTTRKILGTVTIPVTLKISHYFSNLARVAKELSATGVAGITLFNRFYAPDIDIDSEEVVAADVLSSPNEYLLPLRWTGILSGKLDCPLAATTGIHSHETAIKFLLAGASAVQVASVIYQEGESIITKMNDGIATWMDKKGYPSIATFKGKLNQNPDHVVFFERAQFMKYFGEKRF